MLEMNYIADRYEIIDKIGAGGMSDVYKAKDLTLGRFVAIKVLKAEFSEDMNFVTKFRTEAQSAAGLEHPNIVNIYDVGSENGIHYIVMEYVEGITLKTYIEKKGQLTFKEAISIAIQVGRGIEAAHAKNIIHRDIKPQNIIISTEGKVKVTDFGIARAATSNTINSDVMGSVHYSSPEQARNGFVDGKSDIYSLGIVMYEMVTGRVPFDGDTTVAVAIQHLQEDMVIPSVYAPDLPISMEKIILKCTQKNPDRRYESIMALLADLRKALINPQEDFVVMVPAVNQDKTRIIREGDLHQIQKEAETVHVKPQAYEQPKPAPGPTAKPKPAPRPAPAKKQPEPEDEYDYEEEDESEVNPGMEKAITIMEIGAGLIIVAVIIFLLINLLGGFSGKDKDNTENSQQSQATETGAVSEAMSETAASEAIKDGVVVPSVAGKTYEEAQEILNGQRLGIKENGSTSSDEYEVGQIVSQEPAAETTVEANTTILVIVSSGKGSIDIPSVEGKKEAEAVSELSGDFKVNKTYSHSDTVEAGYVMSQSPAGGSQGKPGDTITIEISQGKEAVTVPDVTTTYKSEEQAKEMLKDFVVTVTKMHHEERPAGIVIGQSIEAGKQVEKGTAITITVSDGPTPSQNITTTTYKFKATIKAPSDTSNVSGADIILYDSNGTPIEQWLAQPIGRFGSDGLSLNKGGILSKTGTLTITWLDLDGVELNTESKAVEFVPES